MLSPHLESTPDIPLPFLNLQASLGWDMPDLNQVFVQKS